MDAVLPAAAKPPETEPELPPGEYAIVELFGHVTLIGRIAEVERFGAKMLAIEPLFRGEFLPAIYRGGAALYGVTPCSAAVAFKRQATREYELPAPVRAIVPPLLLAAPERGDVRDAELDDDAEIGDPDGNPAMDELDA